MLACFVLFLIAYIGATAYLVYRDDLLGATLARQVRMQYSYEERIAALRSEIDRVTSRHIVATENVEEQVATLLHRQAEIATRQAQLDGLVAKASGSGVAIAAEAVRRPRARPLLSEPGGGAEPEAGLAYAPASIAAPDPISGLLTTVAPDESTTVRKGELAPVLLNVQSTLDGAAEQQASTLEALSAATEDKSGKLSAALAPLGVEPTEAAPGSPQGGPFIPAGALHFVERAALLDRALDDLAALRQTADNLPLRTPVKAAAISSRFGTRMDPFLHRPALHAGLDFAAPAGATVRATAPGVVISSGWNGGYGQMVEIRHVDGLTTRYAHLSAVSVEAGTRVSAGDVIGSVGSTGRSTGPHLHYETRRAGAPVDPAIYLAAGRAL